MSFNKSSLLVIPYHVLYEEGMQLSYVKVFIEIFSLWHSGRPCFISNSEFARRTNLSDSSVRDAIRFLESTGKIKRVFRDGRRFLEQPHVAIEFSDDMKEKVEDSPDLNQNKDESKLNKMGVELVTGGCRNSNRGGVTNSTHNKTSNNKTNINKELNTYSSNNTSELSNGSREIPTCATNVARDIEDASFSNSLQKANRKKQTQDALEFTRFDEFMSYYPRKQNRLVTQKIWKRKNMEEKADVIISHVKKMNETQWKGKELVFIPLPSTYLNGERWNDEILSSEPSSTNPNQSELLRIFNKFSKGGLNCEL